MNMQQSAVQAQFSATAPLIREAWYVIAEAKDFDRTIKARMIVNEPLIYYRTEAGDPLVMDGRCSHRRFPLVKGKLNGDNVSCGYHGITFAPDGSCTFAPGCPKGPPGHMAIKIFETRQCGEWIWVWMGDGPADPAKLPMPEGMFDQPWHGYYGLTYTKCNYSLMHENLLDLTHVYFLHGAGTFDYANAPLTPLKGGRAGWFKSETNVLTVFGMMSGADPEATAVWNIHTEMVGPGLMYTLVDFDGTEGIDKAPRRALVMQCITPETDRTTNQFWLTAVDVPVEMPEAPFIEYTDFIYGQDVEGLALQQDVIDSDARDNIVEISIPNDRAGLRMRQMLSSLAAEERA